MQENHALVSLVLHVAVAVVVLLLMMMTMLWTQAAPHPSQQSHPSHPPAPSSRPDHESSDKQNYGKGDVYIVSWAPFLSHVVHKEYLLMEDQRLGPG